MSTLSTFFRSSGVGLAATVVDLTALTLLVTGLGCSVTVASVPALFLGVVVQFVGSKWLTFRDGSPRWFDQAWRFLGVEALGLSANALLFPVLALLLPWPYQVARLLTTSVVYFAICLPLWARIFVGPAAGPAAARAALVSGTPRPS